MPSFPLQVRLTREMARFTFRTAQKASERESKEIAGCQRDCFRAREGAGHGHGEKQRLSGVSRSLRGRFRDPSLSSTQPSRDIFAQEEAPGIYSCPELVAL